MSKTEPTGVVRERVKEGIWRRKNARGRWTYEIAYRDSDGRQRRQVVKTGGMREAENALNSVKAKMGSGERVAPNPRLTFAVAAEEWLTVKAPNLTPKTIKTYRYSLDAHLLPAFGRKRLTEIDVTLVSRFIARMGTPEYRREVEGRGGQNATATIGYAVATIKAVLIPLSRTMAYAKRHLGHGGENPVTALDNDERPGYRQHQPKKRKMGRDELDRLIEIAPSPWREIIATAAALGTRMGETLGIEWRHIDFDNHTVTICQQANAQREIARVKTATGVRKIEAPDWLISTFRELKIGSPYCEPEHLVFCTRTGRSHGHGNVLRALYKALGAAGLEQTSFHSLRHTHASLWIKDGGDVITLSKRLGHATPQVTMSTYADEIEEANDNTVRRARVNAMFHGTGMAARMAAAEGETLRQTATPADAEVVSLADVRDSAQQVATA